MTKMAVYQEANVILGSSLSPNNYCICKSTAIANGADASKIEQIVANAANNRLIPVSALQTAIVTYTIRFLDWDGTVLKTESVTAGSNPTPPANPTREGYTFSGWSPTVGAANQNQDYTATYTQNATQYTIIFAEDKTQQTGFYFYMNDGSFVSLYEGMDGDNPVSPSNVQYIAYLGANSSRSFLIDSQDSDPMEFGPIQYSNSSYSQSTGYLITQAWKQTSSGVNSNPLNWVNTRFGDSGFVPASTEMELLLQNIERLNRALTYIGHSPLVYTQTSSNIVYAQQISPNKTYWMCDRAQGDQIQVAYAYMYNETITMPIYDGEKYEEQEVNVQTYKFGTSSYNSTQSCLIRALKKISDVAGWYVDPSDIYETKTVNAGETPQITTAPTKTGYTLSGWDPTPYPADKDEIYIAQWTEDSSGGGDDPSNPYTITCEGIANGGTVYVDVHTTSVSISWSGPDPTDQQWDVSGSGTSPSANSAGGYYSWGSGYVNGLNFTSTTTIQNGGYVSYTVTGIHTADGNYSISGYWPVVVVESH